MYGFKINETVRGNGDEFIVVSTCSFGGTAELKYTGIQEYNLGDTINISFNNSYDLHKTTVIAKRDVTERIYKKYMANETIEEISTYAILTVTMYTDINHQINVLNKRRDSNFDETDFIDIRKSLKNSIVEKINLSKMFYNDISIGNKRFSEAADDMIFAFNSIGTIATAEEKQRINRGFDLFKQFCLIYL